MPLMMYQQFVNTSDYNLLSGSPREAADGVSLPHALHNALDGLP